MGSIEARSDQEFGTVSEDLVAGREGSQLGRVLSKCMCIAVLSQRPTLIYELAIYTCIWQVEFSACSYTTLRYDLIRSQKPKEGWAESELG